MMKVITYGDDLLTQRSEELTEINEEIIKLANDMHKTLYMANGIGLAAVQVGILKRLFVVNIPKVGKFEIINPVILDKSMETAVYEEGCLSLPGIADNVERSESIQLEYLDLKGIKRQMKASGLLAICIQHEIDHLDGILFIDRLSPEEKLTKLKEYRNLHIV